MTFQKKKKKDCRLLDKVRLRNMKAKSREVIITKEKRKLIHVTVLKSKLFSIVYIHIFFLRKKKKNERTHIYILLSDS